jgi:hypothetical protein
MTSTMRFDKWENSLGQPYGTVLQVVQAVKTNTQVSASIASGGTVDIAGLSVSITPKFATSKVLLLAQVNAVLSANGIFAGFELVRDSTKIGAGDNDSNRVGMTASGSFNSSGANEANLTTHMTFLDSPNTTSTTLYKVRVRNPSSVSRDVYINRSISDNNTLSDSFRTICTITLMEIAQ